MQKNITLLTLTAAILITQASGQLYMQPRSISLADAYATQARGSDALGWNPANLGLKGNPKFSLNFGVIPLVPFPSLQIHNNALSPARVYNHILIGTYLDDKAKGEILDFFGDDGLVITPLVQMRILNLSLKSWAFTIGAEVTGKAVAPHSLFNFALFGNRFDEPIDLSETDLQLQSVITIGLAHGWQLNNLPWIKDHVEQLAVGLGVKALVGLGYAGFEDFEARLTTHYDGVSAEGNVLGRAGIGGKGFALDLGAAAQINDKIAANIAFNNLFGSIKWGIGPTKAIHYSLSTEIPSSDFSEADSILKANMQDTVYESGAFSSDYPAYMLLGGEYRLMSNWRLMAAYRQGFSRNFATSPVPAISVGTEYYPISWLPLRFGLAFGGNEGFKWGCGSGLNFKHWRLNWGFSQVGGFFNHGRGIAFSFDQTIIF